MVLGFIQLGLRTCKAAPLHASLFLCFGMISAQVLSWWKLSAAASFVDDLEDLFLKSSWHIFQAH